MKRNFYTMKILQIIMGCLLFSSILYFIIGQINGNKNIFFSTGNSEFFNDDWSMVLEDGTKVPVVIPGNCQAKSGEVLTIERRIPRHFDGTWLCIRSSQQDIKISVDGVVREEYTTKDTRVYGKNSSSIYVFAELFDEDAGKTITIEIVSSSAYSGYVNDIYIGDRVDIWADLFIGHIPVAILALFMLVLSFMVVVYCILIRCFYKKNMDIAYLGLGMFVASMWIISESKLRQMFLPNINVATDVGFFMIMLLPYPFLSYINKIQKRRYERVYIVAQIVTIINALCSVMCQFMNIKDLSETMGSSHALIIILMAIILVTIVLDVKNKYINDYREVMYGFIGMMVAGIYEIYLVYDKGAVFNGMALCIGLVFLFFMAVVKTGRDLLNIEKQKQIAEAASESRTMFLANMSHEIRTPINTIVGMNEMILRENKNNDTRAYAKNIENASKLLLGLIDDILDFSKLDSGKLEIHEVNYYTASMLNDVLLSLSIRNESKKLNINYDIDENIPSILLGDEIRVRQVFNNILSNAIKYTNDGSIDVSIKGKSYDNNYEFIFSVKDTGIGIRPKDMETLFDSFQRMDMKRNKYVQGTGLGLYITKQLIDRMRGSIEVESEYGKGSCFTVRLPQIIIDPTPMGNLKSAYYNDLEKEEDYADEFTAPGARVLVVDDNDMNLLVMKKLLSKTGMTIDFASSGVECLRKCRSIRYDLIFMDHMMPEMDGIETLERLKADEESMCLNVNVIALTANAISGAAKQYEEAGFVDYITKPVEYARLEKTLRKFL